MTLNIFPALSPYDGMSSRTADSKLSCQGSSGPFSSFRKFSDLLYLFGFKLCAVVKLSVVARERANLDRHCNVPPSSSSQQSGHSTLTHTKFAGQGSCRRFPRVIIKTDLQRLLVCDFGSAVVFAVGVTKLLLHVIRVDFRRAQKKVLQIIATRRIVAGVKNVHAFGDGTMQAFPREAVSAYGFSAHGKRAVARVLSTLPIPAFIGSTHVHLFPKSNFGVAPSLLGRLLHGLAKSRLCFARSGLASFAPEYCGCFRNRVHRLILLNRLSMSRKVAC